MSSFIFQILQISKLLDSTECSEFTNLGSLWRTKACSEQACGLGPWKRGRWLRVGGSGLMGGPEGPQGLYSLTASPLLLPCVCELPFLPARLCLSLLLTVSLTESQTLQQQWKPPCKPHTLCAPPLLAGLLLCQSPVPLLPSTGPPPSTAGPAGPRSVFPLASAVGWEPALEWVLEQGASPATSRWAPAGRAPTSWAMRSSPCRTWMTVWPTTWRQWGTWSRPTTSWRLRSRRPWRRADLTSETTASTRSSWTTWGRRWGGGGQGNVHVLIYYYVILIKSWAKAHEGGVGGREEMWMGEFEEWKPGCLMRWQIPWDEVMLEWLNQKRGEINRVKTHLEAIYTANVFKANYSVPPNLRVTPSVLWVPARLQFPNRPGWRGSCWFLAKCPPGLQGPGTEGWTGNSMAEECWSIRGQRDRKQRIKQKTGTLQAVTGQPAGPYIMTLTTIFLFAQITE